MGDTERMVREEAPRKPLGWGCITLAVIVALLLAGAAIALQGRLLGG